jgi:hypothetical protein
MLVEIGAIFIEGGLVPRRNQMLQPGLRGGFVVLWCLIAHGLMGIAEGWLGGDGVIS